MSNRTEQNGDRAKGFIEKFTTKRSGKFFGYHIVGSKPGPQLVVAGYDQDAQDAFEKILEIPTLLWMKGSLVLIRLDSLDDPLDEISSIDAIGHVDHTIFLADSPKDDATELLLRRNCQLILRTCAQLGMIAGRGVAPAGK